MSSQSRLCCRQRKHIEDLSKSCRILLRDKSRQRPAVFRAACLLTWKYNWHAPPSRLIDRASSDFINCIPQQRAPGITRSLGKFLGNSGLALLVSTLHTRSSTSPWRVLCPPFTVYTLCRLCDSFICSILHRSRLDVRIKQIKAGLQRSIYRYIQIRAAIYLRGREAPK